MSDEQVPHRPAPLIPRSPTEVRDEMVRHRKGFAEREGAVVKDRDIERGVRHDLDVVEALRRGRDVTRGRHKKPSPRLVERAVPEDLRLISPAEPPKKFDRMPALHAAPILLGMRWAKAVQRIGLIMHGQQPAPSIEESFASATCPDLALEWAKLYVSYLLRHRESRHNPFRGRSEKDASRQLMRGVMDICDRSTGRLGAWH